MVPVLKFLDLSLTFLFSPFKCVLTYNTPVESYKSIMQWVEQTLSSFCGVETEVERDEPWLYFTAFRGRVNSYKWGRVFVQSRASCRCYYSQSHTSLQ